MAFTRYPSQTKTLEIAHFDVVISGGDFNDDNGFVDHMTVFAHDTLPSTLDESLTTVRSNIRYDRVIAAISENATPVSVTDIELDGSDFKFCVCFDRITTVYTHDVDGNLIDDPIDALTYQIARALSVDYEESRQVYNPTITDGVLGNSDMQVRVTAESLGEINDLIGLVSVTKVHTAVLA